MTWWQAILLGAVQGLGEFLPISSSRHIMFFEQLLNMQIDPNAMMLV
ncbi:MAG: undecaprenyl-diphosphate phosphatase, partial [Clostridia bacterium]|nr:undecaprenyl-diphosphate phosphatase [Clostridia bacterium]